VSAHLEYILFDKGIDAALQLLQFIFEETDDFRELVGQSLLVLFGEEGDFGFVAFELDVDDVQDLALGGQPYHPLLVLTADHLPRTLYAAHLVAGVCGRQQALRAEQLPLATHADHFQCV
jgi:hypothetical protein